MLLALFFAVLAVPAGNAIVNPDRDVLPGEAEWTALLTVDGDDGSRPTLCSGALIAPKLVLTAAHCVLDEPLESLVVYVGSTDRNSRQSIARRPATIIYHAKYERTLPENVYDESGEVAGTVPGDVLPGESSFDSDIALIVLRRPVRGVTPARMPDSEDYQPVPGWRAYGWGATGDDEITQPDRLLTAAQDDHTDWAKQLYGGPFRNLLGAVRLSGSLGEHTKRPPSTYNEYPSLPLFFSYGLRGRQAAGAPVSGGDYPTTTIESPSGSMIESPASYGEVSATCWGDSGGPLVDGAHVLIGLTSMADADYCSDPVPTVFTKVSAFLDWIERSRALSDRVLRTKSKLPIRKPVVLPLN